MLPALLGHLPSILPPVPPDNVSPLKRGMRPLREVADEEERARKHSPQPRRLGMQASPDRALLPKGSTYEANQGEATSSRAGEEQQENIQLAVIIPSEVGGCSMNDDPAHGRCTSSLAIAMRRSIDLLRDQLPFRCREWAWRSCSRADSPQRDVTAHVDALRAFVQGEYNATALIVVDGRQPRRSVPSEMIEHVRAMSPTLDLLVLERCDFDAPSPEKWPGCITAYAIHKAGGAKLLDKMQECGDPFQSQLSRMDGLTWARVPARSSGANASNRDSMLLLGVDKAAANETSSGSHPLGAGVVIMYTILNLLLIIGLIFLIGMIGRFIEKRHCQKQSQHISKETPATSKSSSPGAASAAQREERMDQRSMLITMRCTVPEVLHPGQQLTWSSPSGKLVSMTLPEGSEAGQVLEFQVPAEVLEPQVHAFRTTCGRASEGTSESSSQKRSSSLTPVQDDE